MVAGHWCDPCGTEILDTWTSSPSACTFRVSTSSGILIHPTIACGYTYCNNPSLQKHLPQQVAKAGICELSSSLPFFTHPSIHPSIRPSIICKSQTGELTSLQNGSLHLRWSIKPAFVYRSSSRLPTNTELKCRLYHCDAWLKARIATNRLWIALKVDFLIGLNNSTTQLARWPLAILDLGKLCWCDHRKMVIPKCLEYANTLREDMHPQTHLKTHSMCLPPRTT